MRIALMLRAMDETGGIGIYTRYLTRELLKLDRRNQYVLYYRNPDNTGKFRGFDNVRERVLRASNKAIWDQICVPLACRQDNIDVILHPKFTVPLMTGRKSVMVLHGAGWFMPQYQHFWKPMDLHYLKTIMPLYCKRASFIISVSGLTTRIFQERFDIPSDKIETVYFGPGKHFRPVTDANTLKAVRAKYALPQQFIFTLSKYGGDDRKNLAGIFNAFKIHHGHTEHKLVVGGKDGHYFRDDYGLPEDGYGGDILFPGWMEQEDLPAVYSMADLFLYPSNVEAFPIPITEAMACGTPIITSNSNGLKEIADDAAVHVNADSAEEISDAMDRVLTDEDLHSSLSRKGLARSKHFSWDKCVRRTLEILERVGMGR